MYGSHIEFPDEGKDRAGEIRRKLSDLLRSIDQAKMSRAESSEIRTVIQVEHGGCVYSLTRAPAAISNILTDHQVRIAALAVSGLTNKEIAERMGIALNTVKATMQMILRKLQIASRMDLNRFVLFLGCRQTANLAGSK